MGEALVLKGHGLLHEGWPHDAGGRRLDRRGGPGRAKCACGELSEFLGSDAARKRWHRQHKASLDA